MGQALLLAVLLHVLLVLVFGTAPGGSAKPGEGAWGSINIRLQGDRHEPGSGEPATVIPERGPVGEAKQARSGGAVREKPPTPEERKTPGAARQGQWRQQPGDELTGDAPSDRKAPPAATAPAPAPAPPAPAATTSPAPAAEPTPAPPVDTPQPVPTPLTMPSDTTTVTPTRITPSRDIQPTRSAVPTEALQAPSPVQLPERPAPMLSETPTTLRRLDSVPVERSSQAPLPTQLKAPAALPPLTPAATAAPAPAPTTPATTPTPTPATPPTTASTSAATPSPTQAPANRVSLDGSTAQTSTQPSVGAPDAGARVGQDVATPASAKPKAPKLNLDLNPSRGPMAARGNAYGVVQALPKPPIDKDALAEEMKKAAQQECRKAYADKGLLAVVPLARDAIRDKGCRW